jgi:hypothetical protein
LGVHFLVAGVRRGSLRRLEGSTMAEAFAAAGALAPHALRTRAASGRAAHAAGRALNAPRPRPAAASPAWLCRAPPLPLAPPLRRSAASSGGRGGAARRRVTATTQMAPPSSPPPSPTPRPPPLEQRERAQTSLAYLYDGACGVLRALRCAAARGARGAQRRAADAAAPRGATRGA